MKTAHEYMIALTADERTPSVKAMVDIILLDAAKAIDEGPDDLSEQISYARQDGYDDGYDYGYDEGYQEGFEKGKEAAEQESA